MSIISKCHRLGELTAKSGRFIREKGCRAFFYKSRSFVKGYLLRHLVQSTEAAPIQPRTVSELIYFSHDNLQPLLVFRSPDPGRSACLNFVTDALGASLLGGVGTALIIASQYAVRKNMTLRIITRCESALPTDYYEFMKLMHETPPKKVVFWSDSDRDVAGMHKHPLEISDSDEFFTTSWWTTSAVRVAETGCKVFYLVQETEDFFYPYDDMRLWCSWQMNSTDVCYLVNSHWLWDYFKNTYPLICANGTWFEPAFPRFLYHPQPSAASGKHKLFFYARPNHFRNLYLTGLKVLEEAVLRGILDPEQWEICLAGDRNEKVVFAGGVTPELLGKMTWREYVDFLATVDVAFSLVNAPHPGYLLLESLASGCVCVTNSFENTKDRPLCKNIIARELSIDALCDGLREGVKLALDDQTRRKNFEELSLPSVWSDTLKETLGFMERFG